MSRRNLILSIAALALALPVRAATLSLHSGTCDGKFSLVSSAVSIKTTEGLFIVASADYVLSSNDEKYCHVATDASGSSAKLTLLRYDWATGLALFKAPAPFANEAEALATTKARLLQNVFISTLPSAPRESVADGASTGRIVSATSHRHQFAGAAYALEIEAKPVLPWTVGAAVHAQDQSLIGFVSSHALVEHPGRSSAIARWTDSVPASSATLIVLPAPVVQDWITQVTADSWQPTFVVAPDDQIAKMHAITYGPVRLLERCPVDDNDMDPSNPPIGGADPVGIGGADPVGIGGGSSAYACRFVIEPGVLSAPALSSAPQQLGRDRATQFASVLTRLKAGEKLALKMAYVRDEDGLLQAQPFTALEQFAQAAGQNKFGLLVLPDDLLAMDHTDGQVLAFPALQSDVSKTAHGTPTQIRELVRSSLQLIMEVSRPWGLISVRERSYLYGGLSTTSDWTVVNDNDLATLSKDAVADQSSLIYIPRDVDALIKARSGVTP